MVKSVQINKSMVLFMAVLLVGSCVTFVLHTSSSSPVVGMVVTVALPFCIAALLGVAKTTTP